MGLIDSVRSFITPIQKPADVKSVIDLCHTFALAYLRMKASSGKLYLFHGEKLEDLAWDFIADLFEKDDDGRFRVFCDYFDETTLSEMDENELNFNCAGWFLPLWKIIFLKLTVRMILRSKKSFAILNWPFVINHASTLYVTGMEK